MPKLNLERHNHKHGPGCGHTSILHHGHVDYLHSGHLHHQEGKFLEEHEIEISDENKNECKPVSCRGSHDTDGSEAIPHGDHVDFIVNGRLHRIHDDHCDDHGPVLVKQ